MIRLITAFEWALECFFLIMDWNMLIKTKFFWKRFVADLACELFMVSNMRLISNFCLVLPFTSLYVAYVLDFLDHFAFFEHNRLL